MVYFIQSGRNGPIKIGYSENNVDNRLSDLQVGSYKDLYLLGVMEGTFEDESDIQEAFQKLHIRGEWYGAGQKLKQFIFKHCEKEPEVLEDVDVDKGILLDDILSRIEVDYITRALVATGGNISIAARVLGLSFRSMRYRVDKYGIDKYNK